MGAQCRRDWSSELVAMRGRRPVQLEALGSPVLYRPDGGENGAAGAVPLPPPLGLHGGVGT